MANAALEICLPERFAAPVRDSFRTNQENSPDIKTSGGSGQTFHQHGYILCAAEVAGTFTSYPVLAGLRHMYVSVNLSNQAIWKLSENCRQFVKCLFQSVNLQIVKIF